MRFKRSQPRQAVEIGRLRTRQRVRLLVVRALAVFVFVWAGVFVLPSARADLPSAGPTLVMEPALMDVHEHGVSLLFELEQDAPAIVIVEGQSGSRSYPSAARRHHEIALDGLTAATRYTYRLLVGDRKVASGTFLTAPAKAKGQAPAVAAPIRFIAYGDNRGDVLSHARVVASTADWDPMFVLHLGDMVTYGEDANEWAVFFHLGEPLYSRAPVFPVLGNHELLRQGRGAANYARYTRNAGDAPERYYAFQYGPVRFLVLDSNDAWEPESPQRAWLERELRRAHDDPSVHHLFAAMHHGACSSGLHGEHRRFVSSGARDRLIAGGVSLVFSGHDHMYERGELGGLKYIVTGGAGSPLYPTNRREPYQLAFEAAYHHLRVTVDGRRVAVEARRPDGTAIERCSFERGRPWDCGAGRSQGPTSGQSPRRTRLAVLAAALAFVALVVAAWRWRTRRRRGSTTGPGPTAS